MGFTMAPPAPKVLSTINGIPCFLARAAKSFKISYIVPRISDRLYINTFGMLINLGFESRYTVFIHELHLDAQSWQGDFELVIRTAIQEAG